MHPAPPTPPVNAQRTGVGWRHPHYAQVLQTLPQVAFLQVHSENFFAQGGAALATLQQARSHYPISLHGVGLSLGSAVGLDEWHLQQLARLVERIDPVRVSDHGCFARGHVHTDAGAQQKTVHAADLLPIPFTNEALDELCANVQRVQERLKRPILVENLSAYMHFAQADYSEMDFLNTLVTRAGCPILLDVNNMYVNALNDCADQPVQEREALALALAQDRLRQLRVDAVGELHVAGHCVMDELVIDDHGSAVCDNVWALYAQAVQRFADPPALVEWDSDVPSWDILLAQVRKADAVREKALMA